MRQSTINTVGQLKEKQQEKQQQTEEADGISAEPSIAR